MDNVQHQGQISPTGGVSPTGIPLLHEEKAVANLTSHITGRPPPIVPFSSHSVESVSALVRDHDPMTRVFSPTVLTTRDSLDGLNLEEAPSDTESPTTSRASDGSSDSGKSMSPIRQSFMRMVSWASNTSSPNTSRSSSPVQSPREQLYSYENIGLEKIHLSKEQEAALGASQDQGGHGGTLKGPLTINGTTHQVFLKPFDGVEAKNYELIQKHSPGLAKFMPEVHGLATDSNGKRFLIMENTRTNSDGTQNLGQYGDIKIAGKAEGLENANLICDQGEMQETRGKKKPLGDFMQMAKGARDAPGFMFYKDSKILGKLGRLFNFKDSKANLHEKLLEAKPSAETLKTLVKKLSQLQTALAKSDVALIGGSIIIVADEDGGLSPKLIDPAHAQYNPEKKDEFGDNKGVYFGDQSMFKARRESNKIGITELSGAIADLASRIS